jgi:hypothetical protein
MGWEWRRRQQLAEGNRMMRGLRSWEGADKNWDRRIMECRFLYIWVAEACWLMS